MGHIAQALGVYTGKGTHLRKCGDIYADFWKMKPR